MDYWYPAIRFRRDDDVIRPIRQKEAGDWKKLSLDEKKMRESDSMRDESYWGVLCSLSLQFPTDVVGIPSTDWLLETGDGDGSRSDRIVLHVHDDHQPLG